MSAFETLLLDAAEGPVATLTLSRPDRLNALSPRMVEELLLALEAVRRAGPRVLVLTGAGRAFCAGADLVDQRFDLERPGEHIGAMMKERYNPMVEALATLPCPTIAAVNGVAAGGGASLALLADLVVAARSATFVQVFGPQLGLVPDLGSTWTVPRLVGRARALGLMLLGDRLDAATAAQWGLIWAMVEDDQLQPTVAALAARLAAGPTPALAEIRRLVDASPGHALAEQLELEREVQVRLGDRPELQEGVRAFREKRRPRFHRPPGGG